MSLKSLIVPRLIERAVSWDRVERRRAKAEARRTSLPVVEAFLDPSDPYSRILETVLPEIESRYDIDLIRHIVGPPDEGAAPEREKLVAYAAKDAQQLAEKAGLEVDLSPRPVPDNTREADQRLAELGHYLGGTLYFDGEWYWGLDRLHYLEDRLRSIGVARTDTPPIYAQPTVPSGSGKSGAELHWYLSFRSPYTAIVVDRVSALAEAYDADLKLRFVLPMVMRSLPVPKLKRRYIISDYAREAHRLGVPYGRVCDPVGAPVERGYAILHWAMGQGRGQAFVQSWFDHVWTKGVDAGSDRGMRRIVEAAGLDWTEARNCIGTDDWRAVAEANRSEMMGYGLWGVPSFRVGETATWGQDRLWVIEDELQRISK